MTLNSFGTRTDLRVGGQTVQMFSLPALERAGFPRVARLPYSMKILLENLLRREDNAFVKADDIRALAEWDAASTVEKEISFMPARVLLQDFTGVPCVVDLAAMRDAIISLGGNPDRVNPLQPVELVIDHSVQVDYFGQENAFSLNAELEFSRNRERYAFLRWGQRAFRNFNVVPPDTGIVHQVNIEYLARVVFSEEVDGKILAYPDTLVGTDSHTTMVNGLGVVGWGVGGIEAEAAMLGQPISMLIPKVLGVRLKGALPPGATATDLVLTITEMLRKHGVVGKFVEFFGDGLANLTIADRSTLGNMCPEYGATVAIFPIDEMTLDYLRLTGRDEARVRLVEEYARAQGLFRTAGAPDPVYSETLELDLETTEPSLAGPKRPQDRVSLRKAKNAFQVALPTMQVPAKAGKGASDGGGARQGTAPSTSAVAQAGVAVADIGDDELDHGAVVIAAITSCTNTSNPSVMVGAGLLAKKAVERGLTRKPWVKSSLAPGSKVVTEYLAAAGLTPYLDRLGFQLVGYGCTTCIGNSGPLPDEIAAVVREKNLVVCSVLSGNRNFEGRIQQDVRANYLASPPLVVAYALAGWITKDLTHDPLGEDPTGAPVYLKDLWPTEEEIQDTMMRAVTSEMFRKTYADVF
jgi:aconitate hydratase